MLNLTKKIVISLSGMLLATLAVANPDYQHNIAIDMSDLSTTKEEVAVLQVFSEICPPMLNKKQQQYFVQAYNIELKNLMPSISDPRMAVQYLATQQDYKQILEETRRWTLSFPNIENKQVCTELAESVQS